MIKQAVILAAGNGSRIQRSRNDVPKPLRRVCGLTLIKRTILNAKRGGITDFIVVVGYKGEQIIHSLSEDRSLGVNLRFVHNADYHKSNGVSLLAAQPYADEQFLLLMADHVFDRLAIEKILNTPFHENKVLLGVDRNLTSIFDAEDATKVKTSGNKIQEISKQLTGYDAFDTGIFICNASLFAVLEKIYREEGDASLSRGVLSLANVGQAGVCDISEYFWQDVDTPEALRHAEKFLFKSLRKPTDGWISRNINRPISLSITHWLVRTNLSANHVTGFVTLIGILSGFFVAMGNYRDVVIGGLLFNLTSILDGCDGEMAKLKLSNSKRGEWLDTLSDNITYLAFFAGVAMGAYRQTESPQIIFESVFMFMGILITLSIMFTYLIRYTNSGSLVTIQKDLSEEEKKDEVKDIWYWLAKIKFVIKRDFFAMFFMTLALFNQLALIIHLTMIAANLSWMVILAYKKEMFKVQLTKANAIQ
ncbi:MAG: NTP transferase domain-containing protein [Deltaproteobacteria bacterium]|nr:NTP transferase domain-containing protein [Deltaproteobacteria bacterium]